MPRASLKSKYVEKELYLYLVDDYGGEQRRAWRETRAADAHRGPGDGTGKRCRGPCQSKLNSVEEHGVVSNATTGEGDGSAKRGSALREFQDFLLKKDPEATYREEARCASSC